MKTILDKLGHNSTSIGWTVGLPDDLAAIVDLPVVAAAGTDLIVGFVTSVADVALRAAEVVPHYRRGGRLWFAYPKKTGRIQTDITRDNGWEVLAARELLPVTQIAIDETWSALRFRYRDEIATMTRKTDLPGSRAA